MTTARWISPIVSTPTTRVLLSAVLRQGGEPRTRIVCWFWENKRRFYSGDNLRERDLGVFAFLRRDRSGPFDCPMLSGGTRKTGLKNGYPAK